MTIQKRHLSKPLFLKAQSVARVLKDAGHSAFLVGGCVRNMLCGREAGDFDLTTSATPQEVKKIFPRTVAVGENFGVMIVLEGDDSFEVATFRKDFDYPDGRHPQRVEYGTDEKEDVKRRDFTINGLLLDPESKKVFDYVDGIADIKKKVVRTIGDSGLRFAEDKLRMLRAARFAADMGFEIEKQTFETIKNRADSITEVSAERIREEIVKILTRSNPGRGLELLAQTGLLARILPEVQKMAGVEQPPEFHPEGDVFVHTCLVLDKLEENTPDRSGELAVAALLHDVGKPPTFERSDRIRFNGHDRVGAAMAKTICHNLRFSNKSAERISELVLHHLKFKDVFNMRESTLKRFLGMPYFDEHLALHFADCQASHGLTDAYEFAKAKFEEFGKEEIKPALLVNGKDLIKMGFKPGPLFTEILSEVEEEQLENRLKSKEDAVEFVKGKWNGG